MNVLSQLLMLLWWLMFLSPFNQGSLRQMLLPCYVMADVIAIMFYIGWCYCQLCYGWCYCHYVLYWLLLLPIMLWLMLLPLCFLLADVIANYVLWDIVPHLYCVCGRCYDHFVHGWCCCQGGRWKLPLMHGLMFLPYI